jgi:MFS family permease
MFDFLLSPSGYTYEQIGWIANGNIFGGVLGSVFAGLLLDKILLQKFKESIILLFFMGSCFFLILTLSFSSPLSAVPVFYSAPWLIVSLITFIGFLFGCTYPIFYEFGVELTYPVRESSTSSVFVMLVNV